MSRPLSDTRPDPSRRTASAGSFHAGAPILSLGARRSSTTHRYQTFPTPPPLKPTAEQPFDSDGSAPPSPSSSSHSHDETPLPIRQLLLLAFLSLSEQTALNSIAPYLPEMVKSMPGISEDGSGLYIGILASSFALAQLSTSFLWGYMSDVVGRKPILLAGTFALMCCFCIFGFCTKYWQLILVQVLMGTLNGNAACVPTVLGEVTDRSNQSRAFIYLPVIYSLGSITGPAVGGILVGKLGDRYPYLAPNLLGASMLALSVIVVGIWFEETLEDSKEGPWQPAWVTRLSRWLSDKSRPRLNRNSWSSRWPSGQRANQQTPLLSSGSSLSSDDDEAQDSTEEDAIKPAHDDTPKWTELLNHTTVILLSTYLIFQLSNISFNSLYPIFTSSPPSTGRGLNPEKIGISLAIAGAVTIIFQAFFFGPLKAKMGSLGTYRISLLGIAISMALMPWVGYTDSQPLFGVGSGKLWLYIEIGAVLILKNICAIGGLSSVMLLITNSAPSHHSLGTLNGLAQTLSALGRSIGPFVSGGLFTLSTHVHPKGEALAWSLFGGLCLAGFVLSLSIRGDGLESEDWHGDGDGSDGDEDDHEDA